VSGQVQESIGAIATVQAFVREEHEARRYRAGVETAFRQDARHVSCSASWFFLDGDDRRVRRRPPPWVWLGGRARLIRGDLTAWRADVVLPLHVLRRRFARRPREPVGCAAARGRRDRSPVRGDRHGFRRSAAPSSRRRCPPARARSASRPCRSRIRRGRGQQVLDRVDLNRRARRGGGAGRARRAPASRRSCRSCIASTMSTMAASLFEGVGRAPARASASCAGAPPRWSRRSPCCSAARSARNIAYGRDGATEQEVEAAARRCVSRTTSSSGSRMATTP